MSSPGPPGEPAEKRSADDTRNFMAKSRRRRKIGSKKRRERRNRRKRK